MVLFFTTGQWDNHWGYLVNGITIGVTEVADGASLTAVEELERLLKTIREVGEELGIRDVQKVGWSLFQSLMSDQASTQKAFNSLVEERRQTEQNSNPASQDHTDEGRKILETFCGMHVGVNMRTAEVSVNNLHTLAYYAHMHFITHSLNLPILF